MLRNMRSFLFLKNLLNLVQNLQNSFEIVSNLHKDKLFGCGSATNQSITAINLILLSTI